MVANPVTNIYAQADTERAVNAAFTGATQALGSVLAYNPIVMIFDNQSTVAVAVYQGSVLWKTFSAGESLVLDLRANSAHASTYTFPLGTQFNIVGTGGTGSFRLAILYAA